MDLKLDSPESYVDSMQLYLSDDFLEHNYEYDFYITYEELPNGWRTTFVKRVDRRIIKEFLTNITVIPMVLIAIIVDY